MIRVDNNESEESKNEGGELSQSQTNAKALGWSGILNSRKLRKARKHAEKTLSAHLKSEGDRFEGVEPRERYETGRGCGAKIQGRRIKQSICHETKSD